MTQWMTAAVATRPGCARDVATGPSDRPLASLRLGLPPSSVPALVQARTASVSFWCQSNIACSATMCSAGMTWQFASTTTAR